MPCFMISCKAFTFQSQNSNISDQRTSSSSSSILSYSVIHSSLSSSSSSKTSIDRDQQQRSLPVRQRVFEQRKKKWYRESAKYYATLRRLHHREVHEKMTFDNAHFNRDSTDIRNGNRHTDDDDDEFLKVAGLHYFALTKIRNKDYKTAEALYRKFIDGAMDQRESHGTCDHASLAVTTLLLALHTQRQYKDNKYEATRKTRAVFLRFFRLVGEDDVKSCSCSAKVLQAYALFEMKQGLTKKSLDIVRKAVELDESLSPILKWKMFQDVGIQSV